MPWGLADTLDLTGLTAVVTGANSGIGFETTAALVTSGATVVMACRNLDKAAAARTAIEARNPRGTLELLRLDLANQAQIKDAAAETMERFGRIDRLVNNAGVMFDERTETVDGFEMTFGTNHLGHFAFTGRILPALRDQPGARIVTVSSLSQKFAKIRWDDVHMTGGYSQSRAYGQSKLACLLFSFGLQRRLTGAGAAAISMAAHPGFAATNILHHESATGIRGVQRRIGERFIPTPADACRVVVRAVTDPSAYGGQYFGPANRGQISGPPVPVAPSSRSLDEEAQDRLWNLSVSLTGVEFTI